MKRLKQSAATAVRRCVHGLVRLEVGMCINVIACALNQIAPYSALHIFSLFAIVFWMGAKFRDLTANTADKAR